jgi:hypothetical protein
MQQTVSLARRSVDQSRSTFDRACPVSGHGMWFGSPDPQVGRRIVFRSRIFYPSSRQAADFEFLLDAPL